MVPVVVVLNQHQLAAILTDVGQQELLPFAIYLYDILPSTNQKLWQLTTKEFRPGTVVIAAQQTAGRGQWGRQWYSPTGGLYLSVAIAPNLPVAYSHQLTLCSAWGIAMALRDRGIPVELKWPNDLILEGRKLGGILTETKVFQNQITQAVVGVGINWANSVPETGINLQSFSTNQPKTAITCLEMLAAVTLQGIAAGMRYRATAGIETLLASYHQLLTSRGRSIAVNGQTGELIGITAEGELRVRLNHQKVANSFAKPADSLDPLEIQCKPGSISLGYD